ncbi:MAG: oxygenase MpaB family protein [Novosphingobium sp.]
MQQLVRDLIVDRIRATFNDRGRGERPVQRSAEGLFGPGSAAWRVHGDLTSMMVGGVAALLMQMLHPLVLAGVWDHSAFRRDMHGRLRRTARFIALTTYGSREQAEEAIAQVRQVHARVRGTLPDGSAYSADDPALLGWVHATETLCFLDAWRRYGEPTMLGAEQDRYCAEVAQIGRALGMVEAPQSRAALLAFIEQARPQLKADERTREVAGFLLRQSSPNLATVPVQQLTFQAAIDLLPGWAREMHGLRGSSLSRPLVHVGTLGLAGAIRWAFRP